MAQRQSRQERADRRNLEVLHPLRIRLNSFFDQHGRVGNIDAAHVPGKRRKARILGEAPQGFVKLPRAGRHDVEMQGGAAGLLPGTVELCHAGHRLERPHKGVRLGLGVVLDIGYLQGVIHVGNHRHTFGWDHQGRATKSAFLARCRQRLEGDEAVAHQARRFVAADRDVAGKAARGIGGSEHGDPITQRNRDTGIAYAVGDEIPRARPI